MPNWDPLTCIMYVFCLAIDNFHKVNLTNSYLCFYLNFLSKFQSKSKKETTPSLQPMEFFQRAKVFRLKCSSQTKYLIAHKDEETVKQSRDNSSNNARWSYELVKGKPNVIRLRSCCTWRYLAAVEDPFLLGMTGKKVVQTISQGSIIEWEPIKEGSYIRLKSHTGSTLRANRGPPPYRNSVTHDKPGHWTGTENMTMWIVDIIVIDYQSPKMGDCDSTTSTEEVKRTDAASLSCNVADQQVVLNPAFISPKCNFSQNGSLTNVGPSSEVSSKDYNCAKCLYQCSLCYMLPSILDLTLVLRSISIKLVSQWVQLIFLFKLSNSPNYVMTKLD